MRYLPNIISASRGITAIVMLFFPVFSITFWVLYCWCGFSDMIDGLIARKMDAESETGSRIDSLADFVFLVCTGILILPSVTLPLWIWLWVAGIAAVKTAAICIFSYRQRRLAVPHSRTNKLTGFLLFCLPFAFNWTGVLIPAAIACAVATFSLLEDFMLQT